MTDSTKTRSIEIINLELAGLESALEQAEEGSEWHAELAARWAEVRWELSMAEMKAGK